MDRGGFIKISRKMLNWGWYGCPATKCVFLHLILTANYNESVVEGIKIKRGQAVTSYPSLAENLGLSIRQARTAMEHLKATGEVTVKRYPKFQVVSIVNYDLYQAAPTGKTAGNRQSNDSQGGSRMTPSKKNTSYSKEREERKNGASAECPSGSDAPEWQKRGFDSESEYLAYLRK